MQRQSLRDRDWVRAGLTMLAAVAALGAVLAAVRSYELTQAETRINAIYQKAFYETCELTESMAANYAKMTVAGSSAQAQSLLGDITRQSQGALSNLAVLPLGEESVSATIKFINQAGDFAQTLSQRIAGGEAISEADDRAMKTLSESAAAFSENMNALLARFSAGEALFSESDYAPTGEETYYPLTGAAGEYPTLIYDGPFADAERAGDYRALEGLYVVAPEEAQRLLQAFVGSDAEIVYEGESDIQVACYEFSVTVGPYAMSAGVTQHGGKVLYLLNGTEVSGGEKTAAECADAAERFLNARGYGPLEMSYYSRYDGILTVNFAAVQDGVVLYPDLVKAQVSMLDGRVIGLEADGYLQNHAARELDLPALTEAEAIARLSPSLTPQEARLSVIPINGEEYLCYEITATSASGMYMVYVDAMSGEEREILQVVSSETGTLVM